MAFDFFKRKPKKEKEREILSSTKELLSRTKDAAEKKEPTLAKKKVNAPLSGVLARPHVTEKASILGERGQYVFAVHPDATKGAIRQAVESLYGVEVKDVRVTTKPRKKIRVGRRQGVKPGLRKAVVQLKAGQNIEVISR